MNPIPSRTCRLVLVLALLGTAGHSLAASYCVDSSDGLRAALANAAASDTDDIVRLVRGDYPLDTNLAVFAIRGDLVLRGGHASGCPLLGRSVDPSTTQIFGAGAVFAGFTLTANDSLEIDGLSFEHMSGVRLRSAGDQTQAAKPLTVRRSRFANSIMGLEVESTHHDVRIENNVILDALGFDGNDTDGMAVVHDAAVSEPISVDVLFNTLLGNSRGILVRGGGPFASTPRVQNNIVVSSLTGTGPFTLKVDAAQVAATNNIWGQVVFENGGSLSANLRNVAADPQLDSALVPMAGSPALNSGTDFVAGGVPTTDNDGGPRTIGSLPDRGALESAISDIDTIVVTSIANNGAGTLRQAIIDSNQTVNAELIVFDLGPAGGCPYTISPSTQLPTVTSPLTIDGFTQPGSTPNSRFDRYDAEHCVILSGDVANGLRLQPSTNEAMTVRGLAFQRFTQAAIEVDGPGRAVIHGNSFGVTTNALLPATFAGDAISITGTVGSFVGGTDAGAINLIGNAVGAGLRLSGCSICAVRNNRMGVRVDGYSDLGNGIGMQVVDGDGAITGNVIGHSATQGLRIEGVAASYTVSGNFIGQSRVVSPDTLDFRPAPNGTNGIRLVAGSDHRVSSNRIAHNGTDGLVVLGAVNSANLRGNNISDNGQLGIDLSPDGVDPQDSDLVDGGGNGGQNYPVLLDASGSNSVGTVTGELSSSTGNFNIEAYASDDCDDSGHGEGGRRIGWVDVSITATTGDGSPTNDTVPFSIYVNSAVGPDLGLHGRFITATATRLGTLGSGATSEFSACIDYLPGPELFRDGFEG